MYPKEDGSYSVPKGEHLGLAAWFAKADLGITVTGVRMASRFIAGSHV